WRPQHQLRRRRQHAARRAAGNRHRSGLGDRRRGRPALRRARRTARTRCPRRHAAGANPQLLSRRAQGPFACEGCRRPAPMALSAGLGKRPQDGSGSAVTTDLRLTIGAKKKEEPSFWTGFLDFAAARRGSRSTGIDPGDAVADEFITLSVAEVHHLALGTLLK